MARSLICSTLHISGRVADKLVNKHNLDPAQVREAVEGVGRLPFRWHYHPDRGHWALVVTAIDDEPVLVILYPATDGNTREWWLGSAYRCDF